MGTLYIVPTPIGNLEDITLRALRVLKEVTLIAAEDTRTSRVLLDHYEIKTPAISYHEHNKLSKLDAIFDRFYSERPAGEKFGTHSGLLEACRDLGTAVVAPACGAYGDQGLIVNSASPGWTRMMSCTSSRWRK